MAKTTTEIKAEMDALQATITDLNGLNSVSTTAIYTLIKNLVATAHAQLYIMWDAVRAELNAVAESQILGTKAWYVQIAKNYSSGTVVHKATCLESGRKVIVKVAKLNSGLTVHLTNAELSGLKAYMKTKKIAGTDLDVISQTADLVDITMSIQFTGIQVDVETAVIAGIKSYLSDLPFDSNLSKSQIENFIMGIPGVLDASVDLLKIDYGVGYTEITTNLASPDAGYFEIGKSGGNDLITLNMYN